MTRGIFSAAARESTDKLTPPVFPQGRGPG
jgi:hypothetical protein